MTEHGDPGAVDLAELISLVAREAEDGRRASVDRAAAPDGLQVTAVRVRFGREARPPGDDPAAGPLPPSRYPPAHGGWEIEVDLGPGGGALARVGTGEWGPVAPGRSLADVFGGRPVGELKGAAASWSKRMGDAGIATVAHLAAVAAPDLAALVRLTRSHRPLELRVKAQLLDVPGPWLPPSPADALALWDLAGKTPGELRDLVGASRCSARDADRLADLLARLVTALDSSVLRSTKLGDIRSGPAASSSGLSPPGPPPSGSSRPRGR